MGAVLTQQVWVPGFQPRSADTQKRWSGRRSEGEPGTDEDCAVQMGLPERPFGAAEEIGLLTWNRPRCC